MTAMEAWNLAGRVLVRIDFMARMTLLLVKMKEIEERMSK